MCGWYAGAGICYPYLRDIHDLLTAEIIEELKKSNLFTRGWSLQTLIALRGMLFS
jgi:hypothetical protein